MLHRSKTKDVLIRMGDDCLIAKVRNLGKTFVTLDVLIVLPGQASFSTAADAKLKDGYIFEAADHQYLGWHIDDAQLQQLQIEAGLSVPVEISSSSLLDLLNEREHLRKLRDELVARGSELLQETRDQRTEIGLLRAQLLEVQENAADQELDAKEEYPE